MRLPSRVSMRCWLLAIQLVLKWYFFFFLQITFRGHLMLTTLDEGVLGGCSVDLGEYLCARVVVAKYEQFQA